MLCKTYARIERECKDSTLKRRLHFNGLHNVACSKHTFSVSKGLQLLRAMSAICELENETKKPARKRNDWVMWWAVASV